MKKKPLYKSEDDYMQETGDFWGKEIMEELSNDLIMAGIDVETFRWNQDKDYFLLEWPKVRDVEELLHASGIKNKRVIEKVKKLGGLRIDTCFRNWCGEGWNEVHAVIEENESEIPYEEIRRPVEHFLEEEFAPEALRKIREEHVLLFGSEE